MNFPDVEAAQAFLATLPAGTGVTITVTDAPTADDLLDDGRAAVLSRFGEQAFGERRWSALVDPRVDLMIEGDDGRRVYAVVDTTYAQLVPLCVEGGTLANARTLLAPLMTALARRDWEAADTAFMDIPFRPVRSS